MTALEKARIGAPFKRETEEGKQDVFQQEERFLLPEWFKASQLKETPMVPRPKHGLWKAGSWVKTRQSP